MALVAKSATSQQIMRLQAGRAVNAVAELLRDKLHVPNIYIAPRPSIIAADVLAVDRGGAGDLHAVLIRTGKDFGTRPSKKPTSNREYQQEINAWYANIRKQVKQIHTQLMSLPAHYRYWAIPSSGKELLFGELAPLGLFSPDGIGRVGLIAITDKGELPPVAEIIITPERFRVDGAKLHNIETKLLDKVRPDIEVRI